jgi:SAM-dependent methyltransferase
MEKSSFQEMWETMQKAGYFRNHPHYTDYHGASLSDADKQLDARVLDLDLSIDSIVMPVPYSDALERSVKRTESMWLPSMFDLPAGGTALDIGCGFGRSVAWLQHRYSRVYATDMSAEAIAVAKQRFSAANNLSFHVNEADTLPAQIPADSIDFAYAFTVFQHIPRDCTANLLRQVAGLLTGTGSVVFNLLSNADDSEDRSTPGTEWAIAYSRQQAEQLVHDAGLESRSLKSWSRPETSTRWLWVQAAKPA